MRRLLNENLDEYTRFAAPLILAAFPKWERYASVKPRPDGQGGVVEFNVPCPNPNAESGLFIGTDCYELTVGFDWDHRHFTDYETPCNPERIAEGIEYAREYLSDTRGSLEWFERDRMLGGTSVPLPWVLDRTQVPSTATRYRLRSWTGRLDRDGTL